MSASKHQGLAAAALSSCAASDDQTGAHWRTPPALVERCAALVGIAGWDLDAAATAEARVTPVYLGPDHVDPERRDALACAWDGEAVWCNPPYSRAMGKWAAKAVAEIDRVDGPDAIGLLVFARTDTAWWSTLWARASEVYFFRRRVAFLHPLTGQPVAPAPAPSALVVLRHCRRPRPACFVVDK